MTGQTNAFWTDAKNIKKLRELWMNGVPAAEIGRRMKLSKNSVVGKAHRLSLPPRPSPIVNRGKGRASRRKTPVRAGAVTLPPIVAQAVAEVAPVVVVAPKPARAVAAPDVFTAGFSGLPKRGECMWPFEKVSAIAWRFCCASRSGDRIYCDYHRLVSSIGAARVAEIKGRSATNTQCSVEVYASREQASANHGASKGVSA